MIRTSETDLLVVGCGGGVTSYVRAPDTTLGRVVVYRNGVAYFERYAALHGNELKLRVPAERLDDLLKSLRALMWRAVWHKPRRQASRTCCGVRPPWTTLSWTIFAPTSIFCQAEKELAIST